MSEPADDPFQITSVEALLTPETYVKAREAGTHPLEKVRKRMEPVWDTDPDIPQSLQEVEEFWGESLDGLHLGDQQVVQELRDLPAREKLMMLLCYSDGVKTLRAMPARTHSKMLMALMMSLGPYVSAVQSAIVLSIACRLAAEEIGHEEGAEAAIAFADLMKVNSMGLMEEMRDQDEEMVDKAYAELRERGLL
jgi:hypothetical protein